MVSTAFFSGRKFVEIKTESEGMWGEIRLGKEFSIIFLALREETEIRGQPGLSGRCPWGCSPVVIVIPTVQRDRKGLGQNQAPSVPKRDEEQCLLGKGMEPRAQHL